MSAATVDQWSAAIIELMGAADDFARRAQQQEARRDGARPGTGAHHQYAHSATLWRLAEQRLRARIDELMPGTGTVATGGRDDPQMGHRHPRFRSE